MPLPLAEFFPDGLAPDTAPVEHARPVAYLRRPLDAERAGTLARELRERAPIFHARNVQDVILGLGRVHWNWFQPRSPWRAEAVSLLHAATGYPEAVLDRHLRKLFWSLRRPALDRWLIHSRIGHDPELEIDLGQVVPLRPSLAVVVSSGNIPGAALPSVIQALALHSPCLVKTSSAEPFILPLYARTLWESDPHLGRFLAVTGWEGGDAILENAVLAEADAVTAYGSDDALRDLRSRTPLHARFTGYGHRISFSVIGRECLTARGAKRLATGVALDAALFDQQGCLSPQAVYVERGGEISPETFGELVATQLARLERVISRRKLSPAEASSIHQYRTSLEMRAFVDSGLRLWASPGGTAWTVSLERETELQPCPLNRTVVLRPLDGLEALPATVSGARGMLLSTGLAVDEARRGSLCQGLARLGVTRFTRIGHAQRPKDSLYHDGVQGRTSLLRYVTYER